MRRVLAEDAWNPYGLTLLSNGLLAALYNTCSFTRDEALTTVRLYNFLTGELVSSFSRTATLDDMSHALMACGSDQVALISATKICFYSIATSKLINTFDNIKRSRPTTVASEEKHAPKQATNSMPELTYASESLFFFKSFPEDSQSSCNTTTHISTP